MKSEKKVVFVIPLFEEGGAEKTISSILSGLADNGYEIHLVVLQDRVTLSVPKNVQLHILENRFIKKFPTAVQKKLYSLTLRKLVDQIQPVKIFASLPRAHKMVARTFSKRDNVYYIFHNTPSPSLSHKPFSRKLGIHKLHRLYTGKRLITLSEGIRDDIVNTIGVRVKEVRVINNPFEIETIKALAQEPAADIPEEGYLVCVSHFYKRKRHDLLLKGYKLSGCRYPLVLLGERGEKSAIQELARSEGIANRVLFLGWRGNPYPYIKQAKLLLLTSDEEGMPRAVVESLILHTPVVSTDCPSGPNELLTGDLTRYLVPTGDAEKLGEAIKKALEVYPEICDSYTERFDRKNVVAKYIDLIEDNLL